MGADLISYAVAMPNNKKSTSKLIKNEYARIKKGLKDLGNNPSCADMKKLGVDMWQYLDDTGGWEEPDPDDESEGAKTIAAEVLIQIKSDLELVKGLNSACDMGRDSGWWNGVVRGREIRVVYAGEMSWGDMPDGAGYQTLRALVRLRIADKLESMLK